MKILLNGATAGSNFGDYLFAKIFQDEVTNIVGKNNTFWYKSRFAYSSFFENNLDNHNKYQLNDIDRLICISGGYFCGNDTTLRDYLRRFFAYFYICLKCEKKRIPYALIGVDVAIPSNRVMRRIQEHIIKKAKVVVVRNHESLEAIQTFRKENVFLTADTVFAIERSLFENEKIELEIKENEKYLFFHIGCFAIQNKEICEKIVPIINRFISEHNEFSVIISSDQDSKQLDEELKRIAAMIESDKKVIRYKYSNPLALCKVLDCSDLIITTKLHVGIVGATLGKSVVSFSRQTKKISRLYKQLGEEDRTIALLDLTEELGLKMLETYYNRPICVPENIICLAKKNINTIASFSKGLDV